MGKINDEHNVCELTVNENSANILVRGIVDTSFKIDTTYNHGIIDGFSGKLILQNLQDIRKTIAIMDDEFSFELEYNNITNNPYMLIVKDSKRKIKFTLGVKSDKINDNLKERPLNSIPEPTLTIPMDNEFIIQISKLYGIFKPDTISILNNETEDKNIIKFNSDNYIGEVELVLNNEYVDLFDKRRKNNDDNEFNALYFLKIIETNKSIANDMNVSHIVAYKNDNVPASAIFFDFKSEDIHSKYILLPYIKK